jgi:hypothetical protein
VIVIVNPSDDRVDEHDGGAVQQGHADHCSIELRPTNQSNGFGISNLRKGCPAEVNRPGILIV